MKILVVNKKLLKTLIIITIVLILICSVLIIKRNSKDLSITTLNSEEDIEKFVLDSFTIRNIAILKQDTDLLKSLFNMNTKYGVWAYEHELKKMKYLHNWSNKQGVEFLDIISNPVIRWSKKKGEGYSINLLVSTTYKYKYINDDKKENSFRIGTYHYIDVIKKSDSILISKEWYTDPFADSLKLDDVKSEKIRDYILSKEERDLSNIIQRRKNALEYSDKYVGAADDGENSYKYNPKYKNYNPLGGDCANFASQILFEGGKFRKNRTWNYIKDGSKAWVNANAFKNYMLYSGRASVVASGSYEKVFKAAYKLLPGDFIAYGKKGKVTHISVVTGADSKGYTLVNCHNTDRYRVPWDLGWSDKNIKFWLVHVHY